MKTDVLTSGYVSMDHIIKIDTPAKVGFTSLVTNQSNAQVFYGGCSVNIAYALCRLGMCAKPVLRVGGDYESNGFKKFLEEGNVPLDGITELPEEATSVCYLIQDNHNDHITIFYPGAMDGKYAKPLPDELFEDTKLGVITVASRQDNEEFFENYAMYYGFASCSDCSIWVFHFIYGKLQEDNLRYICFAGWKIRIDTSGSRRTRLAFWFSKWTVSP